MKKYNIFINKIILFILKVEAIVRQRDMFKSLWQQTIQQNEQSNFIMNQSAIENIDVSQHILTSQSLPLNYSEMVQQLKVIYYIKKLTNFNRMNMKKNLKKNKKMKKYFNLKYKN